MKYKEEDGILPDCEDGRGCFLAELDDDIYRIERIWNRLNSPMSERRNLYDAILRSEQIAPGSTEERQLLIGIETIDATVMEHFQAIKDQTRDVNQATI